MTTRGYLLFASIVVATLLVNTVSISVDSAVAGPRSRKDGRGRRLRFPFFDTLSVVIGRSRRASASDPFCDLIVYDEADIECFQSEIWRHVFSSQDAAEGDDDGDNDGEVELEILNELDEEVTMCWVNERGYLRNFSVLNDKSIRDGSVSNRHTEFTFRGHCFAIFRSAPAAAVGRSSSGSSDSLPAHLDEIAKEDFVCLYKPLRSGCRHLLALRREIPTQGRRLGRVVASSSCEELRDDEVIDTCGKSYKQADMSGFRVWFEPGALEMEAAGAALREDLARCVELLPARAVRRLAADTHIYLNKSLTYGTKNRPVVGRSCTYHSVLGGEWLRRNGMSELKRGCVEIFDPAEYVESRGDWGAGAGLLHELCHAYHDKCCPGGFEGEMIREAYTRAMAQGLYERVPVHGRQGAAGPVKAYACTNRMEFFAELSVAYLFDGAAEFNKWFPHNRQQLMLHDPQSCAVLELMWS